MSNTENRSNNINLKRYLIYFLVFVIISFFTLLYIYEIFGKPTSFLIFSTFSPQFILSLFILLGLYFLLDGMRLYYVLKTLNIIIDFKHIFKLVFINIFISNITPFASGGGIAQVYFLNKKGVPLGNATAATTIRTVLASVFIFVSTPIIFMSNKYMVSIFAQAPVFIYLLLFTILYITFFYIVIFKNRLVKKLVYIIFRFLNNRNLLPRKKYNRVIKYIFKHIELFSENLSLFIRGDLWHIILAIIFTVMFLLAEFTFSIIIMRGMGYKVNYLSIIFMQIIVVFFMYFAPTPGATGVAEGGFSLLFSKFVDRNDIFPLIFSWRLFTKYIGIGIGMILFFIMLVRGERRTDEK